MMASRLRVLVADDHPGMVRAISRLLAMDYDVVASVGDGHALLDAVQRLQPELIVLDMNLPGIHGLKACRQITQESPEIKVIMFTAGNDPELRQRAFAAGASAFVDKLASTDDLLSVVNGLDNR
jgi:CheY-like chemotaxis protein